MSGLAPLPDKEAFRSNCAAVQTWDEYFELSKRARSWPAEHLWHLLWLILLDFVDEQSDRIAGYLLIDIDPEPREPLETLLARLANSRWYLSNREVPFYLVSQFGKRCALDAICSMLRIGQTNLEAKIRLESVLYFARMPTSLLADRLHYFQWQEVIERNNNIAEESP